MKTLVVLALLFTMTASVAHAAPKGPYYISLTTLAYNAAMGGRIPDTMILWRQPIFPDLDACAKWITRNIPTRVHDRLYDEYPGRVFECKTESTGDYPFSVIGTQNHWAGVANVFVKATWVDQPFKPEEWQR